MGRERRRPLAGSPSVPRFRVLVPRGRALERYLLLPLWETAHEALRLLADDPRPSWAAATRRGGYAFFLEDGSWVAYEVDDEEQLVTVVGAGGAPGNPFSRRV